MVKLCFLFLLVSFQLFAETKVGEISQIDYPKNPDEQPLLFISDGSVLKVNSLHKQDLLPFIEAKRKQLRIKFTINSDREIIGMENLGTTPRPEVSKEAPREFQPSILVDDSDAKIVFRNLRKRPRSGSQCYNRAHIWSYETKGKYDINTMKVFMFYTRRYIREYNFEWWFHVAPFTYVASQSPSNERVLDPRFAGSPLPTKRWTDIFMQNNAVCPVITAYSQYSQNQESAYCYLFKTSMYDYQPLDLEGRERTGVVKRNWINWEVNMGYRDGFGIW